ncbi:hypothetical protein PTKIN_Ptkin14bG0209800 [Pterospermum kingtungense]
MDLEDRIQDMELLDDDDEGIELEKDEEHIQSGLSEVWRPVKGVHVKDIANQRFLSQFFHELDINTWLHIYDLPTGYFTEKVGKQLGSFVGEFLEYDAKNVGSV